MVRLNVEFFHDVICSFCYPMSYRMRQIDRGLPEVNIIHRSFALAPDENALAAMFGSREKAKGEILTHWAHANQNDDLHRFNIEGMKEKDFLFPTSMNALLAAKAASFIGGEALYWDVFDALQKGLFTDNRNIEDEEVITQIVSGFVQDLKRWQDYYHSGEIKEAVEKDLALARQYGIRSVPSLVIDGRYLVNGAQPYEELLAYLQEIIDEKPVEEEVEPVVLEEKERILEGEACNIVNGKWECD